MLSALVVTWTAARYSACSHTQTLILKRLPLTVGWLGQGCNLASMSQAPLCRVEMEYALWSSCSLPQANGQGETNARLEAFLNRFAQADESCYLQAEVGHIPQSLLPPDFRC